MARLSRSSPTCARAARVSLAAFLDAVVIADPVQYQRRRDERDDVSMPLRSLHFGPSLLLQPSPSRGRGIVTGASGLLSP